MERGLERGTDASYEDWKCEGIGSQHWNLKLVRELAGLLKLFLPSSLKTVFMFNCHQRILHHSPAPKQKVDLYTEIYLPTAFLP